MLKLLNGVRLVKFEPQVHTPMVYQWYYDPHYSGFFRAYPTCPSLEEVGKSVFGKTFMIIFEEKLCGMVMYFNEREYARNVEIAVLVDKSCEHKKIGVTAQKILAFYLLNTLNLYKVCVTILHDNVRLNKIVEQVGYTKEGHFKNHAYFDGEFHDECFWTIAKGDFNKRYKQEFAT